MFTSESVSVEERGDLPPHGSWTTLAELAARPHQTEHVDHGRGVHSLRRLPRFAIGHRSFVVQTGDGNLLWDAPSYLDDEIVSMVRDLGGVTAVAASHPHMFGAQPADIRTWTYRELLDRVDWIDEYLKARSKQNH